MEYKIIQDADVKLFGTGFGELSGYASTFANWDSVGERPIKGAFAPHLESFLTDGFIAVGHDWAGLPIATPVEAREDDRGLFVKAAFHSTAEAQAARTVITERIERGKSVKLSIGYEVLDSEMTKEGRLLKEIKLHEWSIVTVPANPLAAVTYAKRLPPEGAPLAIYQEAVEAAHTALIREIKSLEERRSKAGRMISEANLRVIVSCVDALETALTTLKDLYAAAKPIPEDPDPVENAEVRALWEAQDALFSKLRIANP